MRRLSDISEELVSVGERWWGHLYWIKGGSHGFEVRRFTDPFMQQAYVSLLEEAYCWGHADAMAWHVLVIDAAHEVGEDFVMIRRCPGIQIDQFDPEHTDDPVDPPGQQLEKLRETVARMHIDAESPSDKFIADLVAKRLAALDHHLVYDVSANETRFHLYDLDPGRDELVAWSIMPRNPD